MPGTTWEEVLKRDDIVGGDLETQEGGTIFRGPITGIEMRGKVVYITMSWVARFSNHGWVKWHTNQVSVNAKEIVPNDIGGGRIHFTLPFLVGFIFPKGGSKLNPAKVQGLELTTP